MFYTFKNSPLTINGSGIFCTDAQLSLQTDLSPQYLAKDRNSLDYRANQGLQGLLSLNYPLTGKCPLHGYLYNESSLISGNFAGLSFASGYLQSYNLNCSPHKSAMVSAEIVFFDELKGVFAPAYENAPDFPVLNFKDVTITDPTNGSIGSISNILNLNYNFTADIKPLILAEDTVATRISYGIKEVSASIETDNLSGDLPVTGKRAGVQINFTHPFIAGLDEYLLISGRLSQRNITSKVGDLVKSNLFIRQNYVDEPPQITAVGPPSLATGDRIRIEGESLRNVRISFHASSLPGEVIVDDDSTVVSGVVPVDALSGPITIENYAGLSISDSITINYAPIAITNITPISGEISGAILISGTNFYHISNVLFTSGHDLTGTNSSFQTIDGQNIEAIVPEFAAWGPIRVISDVRDLTGVSSINFIPIPRIDKFTPKSGMVGTNIIVEGRGFSGVSGISINNIFASGYSILSNTGLQFTVPSGNVKGSIKVFGREGVSATSWENFFPEVRITGLSPTGARTGAAIEILGENFYYNILKPYNESASQYVVDFGYKSGIFIRINNTRLTGLVPYGATSGPVFLLNTDGTKYSNSGYFRLQHQVPTISGVTPMTGFYSGYGHIQGTEFFDTLNVRLAGTTGTIWITGSNTQNNNEGTVLTFPFPVATGGYYHLTVQTPEGSATLNSGVFIRTVPILYSFNPTSGAIGNTIRITGRNLYPDSFVYLNGTGTGAFVLSGSPTTGHDTLHITIPSNAPTGQNNVIVYNWYGWVTGNNAFRLIDAPTISGFSPISGAYGDSISISGTFLNNVTGIYINSGYVVNSGQVLTFTAINNTGITFTIPENIDTNPITLKYLGHDVVSTGQLYITTPTFGISGINPTTGYWGDSISISGSRLNTIVSITFSGLTGEMLYSSGFSIVGTTGITTPIPLNSISGTLKLQNTLYTNYSTQALVPIPYPTINYVNTYVLAYNQTIYLTGYGFSGKLVLFPTVEPNKYVTGLNHQYFENTGILCQVPREVGSGYLGLTGAGTLFNIDTGVFVPIPQVSGWPTTIITGQTLTLTGINIGAINPNVVFISGVTGIYNILSGQLSGYRNFISGVNNPATGWAIVSGVVNNDYIGTGYLILVPSYYSGITNVESLLSSEYASYLNIAKSGNLQIKQYGPTILGFSPNKGNNNTILVLSGTNLAKSTGLYIESGSSITQCTLINSGQNEISFYGPSSFERSGRFRVYTEFGNVLSTSYFTFIETPYISGLNTLSGPTGSSFLITGSGIQDITGVKFRSYLAPFTIRDKTTYFDISGTVPLVNETYTQNYPITIISEAGTGSYSTYFTIHPGPTEFRGQLSGTEKVYSTGFKITNNSTQTGIIYTSHIVTSGANNYLVQNALIEGIEVRMFSYLIN